jgi:hypothetical protein
MGVSVRLSRNTRVYLPFWFAIPLYAVVGAVWAVILVCVALWWLLVVLPPRGITAWQESRATRERAPSRPQADSIPAAPPDWAPPQDTPGQLEAQARIAEQPPAEERRNSRSEQRQAQLAARNARRQAEAPGRAAADRAHDAARRERKAAFKAARGPWRWPEWTLISAVAAFVAFVVLAAATGTHMPTAAGVPLFLIWFLGGLVGIPAVIWRWYRAWQAAAAMLAGNPERETGG